MSAEGESAVTDCDCQSVSASVSGKSVSQSVSQSINSQSVSQCSRAVSQSVTHCLTHCDVSERVRRRCNAGGLSVWRSNNKATTNKATEQQQSNRATRNTTNIQQTTYVRSYYPYVRHSFEDLPRRVTSHVTSSLCEDHDDL